MVSEIGHPNLPTEDRRIPMAETSDGRPAWTAGRWWRVMRDGKLISETSDYEEAKATMKVGDRLEREYVRTQYDWRIIEYSDPEARCGCGHLVEEMHDDAGKCMDWWRFPAVLNSRQCGCRSVVKPTTGKHFRNIQDATNA